MISQETMPPRACQSPVTSSGHRSREISVIAPRAGWSVPVIRHQVGDLLRQWQFHDIATDAELMTSELAANAVQHATGPSFAVSISASAGLLVVEVFDADPRLPSLREPDPDAERGRGLATLAALAKDWGAVSTPPGKCVWFTLPLPRARRDR